MWQRLARWGWMAVLVILVCLGCGRGKTLSTDVERLKQKVVVGMTRSELQAKLRDEGVEHSWDPREGTVLVLLRDAGGGAFVSRSVQGIVTVETDERVSSVQWRDVYTGP